MSSPIRSADTTESDSNLDDTAGEGGDNSILGKVKSRVTSIFPNSFSKWFSPSTRCNNDSQNGSLNTRNISGTSRRRRRIEVEAEEDDELIVEEVEDTEQQVRRQCKYKNTDEDEVDEEESDNSADDNTDTRTSPPIIAPTTIRPRRSINTAEQPPVKRKRLELNETNMREEDMPHQLFVASTPAASSQLRGSSTNSQFSRGNVNRFKHLNLSQSYKLEPAYNFAAHIDNTARKTTNIIDLVKGQSISSKLAPDEIDPKNEYVSSRRSLNIYTSILSDHKRPALSSILDDSPSTSCGKTNNLKERHTLTTTHDVVHKDLKNKEAKEPISIEQDETVESAEGATKDNSNTKYNGRAQNSLFFTNKRQKLINGGHSEEQDHNIETASESSDGSGSVLQRKTGLFNNANSSRTGSRTSSIGNGLNFFTHLEGRKSLFAGPHAGNEIQGLNNSTLSLTSFNRRQFNASIYGSTSALSDSRLLNSVNTASPFYNGRTTYGGAAAYNKYSLTGAGTSSSRLTPTLIRPTSSLSTLSSSNASIGTGLVSSSKEHPHLSNTAKSILNLINDFSTPLNEVRKMANNLKPNQQPLTPQTRNRLNETNLEATRTMRLSQVPKPYMRSVVTLQPNQLNGTGANTKNILPPVRELQVPSMSQLLQMKKIQSSTERSRQISSISDLQSGQIKEYTLPITEELTDSENKKVQKKHTSKIKSKLTTVARVTGSKHHEIEDRPPSPVNLPNIAFPLMKSMPKIDIQLPSTTKISNDLKIVSNVGATVTSVQSNTSENAVTQPTNTNLSKPMFAFNNNNDPQNKSMMASSIHTDTIKTNSTVNTTNNVSFTFSSPMAIQNRSPLTSLTTKINNYKFSPPTTIVDLSTTNEKCTLLETATNSSFAPTTRNPVPQLKTGSVLDALKGNNSTLTNNTFGSQFLKSPSEWECDTCMIRNNSEKSKCVACETPRKSSSNSTGAMVKPSTNSIQEINSFGSQFKKSANEWECDACMIQNKQSETKCIACETPKKDAIMTNVTSTNTLPLIKNTFGDSFKPKGNTWECPTCLINNNSNVNECVACQTKNPKAKIDSNKTTTAPTSAFKFGFATVQTVATAATDKVTQDSGFKTIVAQQKASSWECEACMTRNDATRSKCICCEQAKPGTQTTSDATPKFSFGTSTATKFSFGFPSTTNSSSTPATSLAQDKTEETPSTSKESNSNIVGNVTSTSSSTGTTAHFTFGLPQTSNEVTIQTSGTTRKDVVDSSKNSQLSGFKFGASEKAFGSSPIAAVTTTSTTLTNTSGFTFDQGSKVETAKTNSTTSTTIATNTTPSVTFKLPATTLGAAIEPIKPEFTGFNFGATSQTTEVSKTATSTTADFAFKVPQTPANTNPTTSTATITTATVTDKPVFSFGVHNPPATTASNISSTTAAMPTTNSGFSFGSNTKTTVPAVANKTLFGIVSSSSTTSLTTTAPANNIFGQINNTSNTTTAVTSTTSTFGSFTAVSSGKNAFGSFGQNAVEAKPNVNATPVFGSTNSGTVPTNASTPFLFGGSTTVVTTTTTNTTNSTTTTTPSWTKNSFVFGSGTGGSTSATPSTLSTNTNASTDGNKSTVFGSFATNNSSSGGNSALGTLKGTESAPATFGSGTTASVPAFGSANTAPAFGSNLTSTINSNTIFGTNATPGLGTTNIFGTSASGNATTPQVPAFGAAPAFGGSASTSSVTPTFGSTAASAGTTFGNSSALSATPTFGSFSAAAAAATATTATTTQDVTTKKAEPFKFGDVANNQNSTGIFNFGASAATPKPAFNFSATTTIQPSFNFSGTNEATPNAPFQFNAGTAPATNNIFAPGPTPGAPTPQQPRRKIRAPIRRLTPR